MATPNKLLTASTRVPASTLTALRRSKQGRPAASIFSTATSSRGSAPSSLASNLRPSASTAVM